MEDLAIRIAPASLWLATLWCIETFATNPLPFRYRHGAMNLSLACLNGSVLFFTFGTLSIMVCAVSPVTPPLRLSILHAAGCFVALDLLSYVWHRMNHAVPILWRIHSVHHSDNQMDVTTAGRFHTIELAIGAALRLPLLYILGVSPTTLLTYETALVTVSMFHHSRLSFGRYDRFLRAITASPLMHSIHHSSDPADFETNFSSVFSIWDRIFSTYRVTDTPITHGLRGVAPGSVLSMIKLPFAIKPPDRG